MQLLDYLLQLLDVGHAAASSQSPTLQNVPVTPAAIARSAAQGVVPFDEVVIGEVKANRRLKVLPLLAESQREPGKPAHVKASGSVQPLDVAGRNQVESGRPATTFFSAETNSGALYRRLSSVVMLP